MFKDSPVKSKALRKYTFIYTVIFDGIVKLVVE